VGAAPAAIPRQRANILAAEAAPHKGMRPRMNADSSPGVISRPTGRWKREAHRKKTPRFNHLPPVPQKRLEIVMNVTFLFDSQEKFP
jgi:hypothetical protein